MAVVEQILMNESVYSWIVGQAYLKELHRNYVRQCIRSRNMYVLTNYQFLCKIE